MSVYISNDERLNLIDNKGKNSINVRLDNLIFHSVTANDFQNNILPKETNNSHHVYFVHSQSEIQLWKGNIRIPFGGEGETWTVGVINVNSLNQ
jgi:hypothetical protein